MHAGFDTPDLMADDRAPASTTLINLVPDDEQVSKLAKAFFMAATKESEDDEDILPQVQVDNLASFVSFMTVRFQEDGDQAKLSVFHLFCELFPEVASVRGDSTAVLHILFVSLARLKPRNAGRNKRLRLHFNKIGYQIYGKEQSRRVLPHTFHPPTRSTSMNSRDSIASHRADTLPSYRAGPRTARQARKSRHDFLPPLRHLPRAPSTIPSCLFLACAAQWAGQPSPACSGVCPLRTITALRARRLRRLRVPLCPLARHAPRPG
jgi:hypothetical protein